MSTWAPPTATPFARRRFRPWHGVAIVLGTVVALGAVADRTEGESAVVADDASATDAEIALTAALLAWDTLNASERADVCRGLATFGRDVVYGITLAQFEGDVLAAGAMLDVFVVECLR